MNKEIIFYAYRDWAKELAQSINIPNKIIWSEKDYSIIERINPNYVFFLGWSDIVPSDIVRKYKCICLHPSELPEYRGGSPLQNQIINGEKSGAVSLFLMNDVLDGGDVIDCQYMSLYGDLADIFKRININATQSIEKIISMSEEEFQKARRPQDLTNGFVCKRRMPKESEITLEDIQNSTANELHDKIRALQDPYPNAFIRCKNGEKLYLLKSRVK